MALRAYLRHRERLVDDAAVDIQHLQKALMQMNVQLHHAVTDITGVTEMRIIRAIVAGTRAPEILAKFRDPRCAASEATLRAALTGPNTCLPSGMRWSCMTFTRRRSQSAILRSRPF